MDVRRSKQKKAIQTVRSSYGLVRNVQHVIDEYRTMAANGAANAQRAHDYLCRNELLFVRAKARHWADFKQLRDSNKIDAFAPNPSAAVAELMFTPDEETLKQLGMADKFAEDLIGALHGIRTPQPGGSSPEDSETAV